jgi:peptidoglycan hydrolase CwlO-like protein
MWRKVVAVIVIIAVIFIVVYIAWRGFGIEPAEYETMSGQITTNEEHIAQLQKEVQDLQSQVQADRQRIDQLEAQVAGPR